MSDLAAERLALRVSVREGVDVAMARQRARELARRLGWPASAVEALATAVSEVAHNIIAHAEAGEVLLDVVTNDRGRAGVVVVARDRGPGIPDVELAMQDGYSTAGGLGLGLPSARRLVDEFELVGGAGRGATVIMRKWSG
jgi:serine/threonine-protein kinase RsbT